MVRKGLKFIKFITFRKNGVFQKNYAMDRYFAWIQSKTDIYFNDPEFLNIY